MGVGDKIKNLRESIGLTQTELGEKLGVKKNAVSKWECGRVEDIPTSKIKALANLFGVAPSFLIDDDADDSAPAKSKVSDDDIQFALFGGRDEITEKMYEEVKNFAAYLKQREGYNK
jgi:transcriptional regulator with XRE-family HTH domain